MAFFESVLTAFRDHVTVANLNYDTLVLAVLADDYREILSDMAHGRFNAGPIKVGGVPYATKRLRLTEAEFMSLDERRLRLLHLHGSLTYWQFGPGDYRKLPVEAVRGSTIWEILRNENTFTGTPLVVLANQHEKVEHVTKYPYNLAYELAESDFKDASRWLIVGYSFRDISVNDLLSRCWEARKDPTTILVVTNSDRLQAETIEEAFGWELGSGASNGLIIDRSGAFGLASSPNWTSFTSA